MKWVYLFTLIVSFTFQSCEKDLNEETQTKEQSKEGKINYLTIEEVPFLRQNVETFQSSNSITGKSSGNTENDVKLDLQHIIEYDGADDFKSYTLPVVSKTVETDEYYFENLHILKDGDKYESFVVRYFPKDETKKFELNHFTGKMQFFDDAKKLRSTLYFENGEVKKTEQFSSNKRKDITSKLPDALMEEDCDCNNKGGSLLSQFFNWVSGAFSNINISFGSGGNYMAGDGSYGGEYFLSIGPPNSGNGYNPGGGNSYSGGNGGGSPTVVFVPSQVQSEYQRMQVVDIVRKLGTIDSTAFLWMMDYNNADDVNYVYYVLNENEENTPETLVFLRKAIITLKAGGEVDYWFKVIVDKSFKENPCLYGVYTKLGYAPTFQKYLKKFDGNFSIANLQFNAGVDPNFSRANAVTYSPINYLIEIKFNPQNLQRPALDIARTFIHEIIHAEIYRKLLSCSRLPYVNTGKMTDSQWQIYINNLKNNFPTLFDYYMRYLYNIPANQQISDPQHELMAQHYRQIVVQVLKQYDGNAHSDDFYNALAWIGLMGEGEFSVDSPTGLPPVPSVAWKNVPQAQRLQILSTYKNFLKTNTSCQ